MLHQFPLVDRASLVHGHHPGHLHAMSAMLGRGRQPVVLLCASIAMPAHTLELVRCRVCCVNLGRGLLSAKRHQALNASRAIAAPLLQLAPHLVVLVQLDCIRIQQQRPASRVWQVRHLQWVHQFALVVLQVHIQVLVPRFV